MKISIFKDGYANLISDQTIEDWDSFCDLLMTPKIGIKNGDYFVRGFCDGARGDTNMKSIDLIIIDGDQLESDGSSCCPPEPVHEVMKNNNITHVIHTSYSNDIINGRHKWRMIIPCSDITDIEDLSRCVGEIIAGLHSAGLMVRNVKENLTLSQPWFTPRCPEFAIDDFYSRCFDGVTYKIGTFKANGSGMIGEKSPVDSINGQFSWRYVSDLFLSGTVHIGIRAAAGWLIRTTDWADSQIIEHLSTLVEICPDQDKVKRAKSGEIKKLVEYCRKKAGIIINDQDVSWRAYTITADNLQNKDFPPVRWAVDSLIPEGLTILAGDPKSGKSLLAVDICSAITSGEHAMGVLPCVQGAAIYVSLEDPERRVKARIHQQCDKWPGRFILITGGINPAMIAFAKQAEEMIMTYPDARAIIVDTMNFIVPEKAQNVSDYNHYYSVLSPLQKWALLNHVALILITHKSKAVAGNQDNPFSGILGSVAIQGCSDCMIMLSKNHEKEKGILKNDETLPDGFLSVIGREIGAETFPLEFDSEALKWAMTGDKFVKASNNLNWLKITGALKSKKLTPKEISVETKINRATTRSCLKRMTDKKIITEINGIYGIAGQDYSKTESRW